MEYDANGIRRTKQIPSGNNAGTTTYAYSGSNLVYEKQKLSNVTHNKYFLYNNQGIIGFVYDGVTYMFRKNLFGDITAIYRGNTKVAEYRYDTWGNCLVIDPATGLATDNFEFIGHQNPFRYRGYYWDNDLQLYYLMSRYYDPQTGRFISPTKASSLNPQAINGLNLYSYAKNNPIYIKAVDMRADSRIDSVTPQTPLNPIVSLPNSTGKYSSPFSIHWKNEWVATDWPSLFVFSNTKGALIDWGLSIYKGSLYFDEAENHSIYIGVGNASAFIGYDVEEEKFGVFADISVLSAGYDGRYIDASISVVGVGFVFGFENKKFRVKLDPVLFPGIEISIDFGQIIKDIFGWEG